MKVVPRGAKHIIRSNNFDGVKIEGDDINPANLLTISKELYYAQYIIIPAGQKSGSTTMVGDYLPSTYKVNSSVIDQTARYIKRASFNTTNGEFTIEMNANASEEVIILVTFINRELADIV